MNSMYLVYQKQSSYLSVIQTVHGKNIVIAKKIQKHIARKTIVN